MSTTLTPELVEKADRFLDDDDRHRKSAELGEEFYGVFTPDKERRISTQVRNLQQVVVSATRFADIEDFVKGQMGRKTSASQDWRKVGERTLTQLSELRSAAAELTADESQRLLLRLHIARGWVRAVVGAYLYAKAREEMNQAHA